MEWKESEGKSGGEVKRGVVEHRVWCVVSHQVRRRSKWCQKPNKQTDAHVGRSLPLCGIFC